MIDAWLEIENNEQSDTFLYILSNVSTHKNPFLSLSQPRRALQYNLQANHDIHAV